MREQWYGDDRDVVKWSALVHLARRESIAAILHVAMYRPSQPVLTLATAVGPVAPPDEVLTHFRDLGDIQRLAGATGLEIEAFTDLFTHRSEYFRQVCARVRARNDEIENNRVELGNIIIKSACVRDARSPRAVLHNE